MPASPKLSDPDAARPVIADLKFAWIAALSAPQLSAALAFIVGGAVTSVPALLAVYPIVKRKVFALYIFCAVAGAVASGYLSTLIL